MTRQISIQEAGWPSLSARCSACEARFQVSGPYPPDGGAFSFCPVCGGRLEYPPDGPERLRIEELGLSSRVARLLTRWGFQTAGDLVLSGQGLMEIPSFGRGALAEIEGRLVGIGLSLAERPWLPTGPKLDVLRATKRSVEASRMAYVDPRAVSKELRKPGGRHMSEQVVASWLTVLWGAGWLRDMGQGARLAYGLTEDADRFLREGDQGPGREGTDH